MNILSECSSAKKPKLENDNCFEKDNFIEESSFLCNIADELLACQIRLIHDLNYLHFTDPVSHVYNPLTYAFEPYSIYVKKYCTTTKHVLFIGMNPGPFGMAQTGIMESRKRHTLTLEERVQIIKMVEENNMSTRKLAELFECGRTQVNDILKKKEQILKDWNENLHSSVKRRKSGKYDNVNIALLEWFKCARAHRLALSGPILKEQALKIAQDLGCTEFCASNGWFNKFCIRNNIQFRAMSGVSRNVRPLSRQDWIERIPQLLKDYNLQNVFTVSETGLFFRALPTKNMTLKADKCTTGNMSNERLTVSFCVSAGGEKLAPLVIGRVIDNPKSLTDINDETVTVHYRQNKKSWMTAELFNEWLKHLNKKLRQCNRKILLFVTNTPCHKVLELFSNVDLRFLSASGTAAGMSHFQPLDQDVIQTFKLSYRKRVLKHVVARLNDASSASELAKSITIGLAIEWIGAAWQDVKAETIVKCFANCGFTSNLNSNIDAIIDNTQLHTELEALCHVAHVDFSKEAHMEDNKLECYDKLRGRDGELLETSLLNDDQDSAEDESMLQSHLEVNGMPQVINLSELLKLTEQCRQASKNKNGISDKLVKIYSQAIDIIEDQLITEKFKKKKKVKQTSVT